VEEWIGILRLATQWEFQRARHESIENLNALIVSPARRIQLAREFDIPGWQISALQALVLQKDVMSAQEVNLLGVETVLNISALREEYGVLVNRLRTDRYAAQLRIVKSSKKQLSALGAAKEEESDWLVKRYDAILQLAIQEPMSDEQRKRWKASISKLKTAIGELKGFIDVYNHFGTDLCNVQDEVREAQEKIPSLSSEILRERFGLKGDD
jgi:hypothetical protein